VCLREIEKTSEIRPTTSPTNCSDTRVRTHTHPEREVHTQTRSDVPRKKTEIVQKSFLPPQIMGNQDERGEVDVTHDFFVNMYQQSKKTFCVSFPILFPLTPTCSGRVIRPPLDSYPTRSLVLGEDYPSHPPHTHTHTHTRCAPILQDATGGIRPIRTTQKTSRG